MSHKANNLGSYRLGEVILLDGRSVELLIQPRLFAGDLFDMVASHFNLKEKEYFGLAFLDETGQYSWLNLQRRVLEHEYALKKDEPKMVMRETPAKRKRCVRSTPDLCLTTGQCSVSQTSRLSTVNRIRNLKKKKRLPNGKQSTTGSTGSLHTIPKAIPPEAVNRLTRTNRSNSSGTLSMPPLPPLPPLGNGFQSSPSPPGDPLYDVIHENVENNYSELDNTSHCNPANGHCEEEEDHDDDDRLVLYFLVKYFVESITMLQDTTTIELFYLQAKSLLVNEIVQADLDTSLTLSAFILQATYGSLVSECRTRSRIHKLQLITTSLLNQLATYQNCEDRIIAQYRKLNGTSQAEAIFRFMCLIEKQPTYGVHFYEVKDKSGTAYWLGLSFKGIDQFDYHDRRLPWRQFSWKQLENLYFREKKFSIEVRDPKRVVHTLSSINLYENAIEDVDTFDDLSSAICDPTTQVSVSRRTFGPSNVTVYVWFAATSSLTKCIWSMAISQHQFYIDRRVNKCLSSLPQSQEEIIRSLEKSISRANSAIGASRPPQPPPPSLSSANTSPYSSNNSLAANSDRSSSESSSSVSNASDPSSLRPPPNTIHRMNSFKINRKNKMNRLRQLQTQLNAKYEELKRLELIEQEILSKASQQSLPECKLSSNTDTESDHSSSVGNFPLTTVSTVAGSGSSHSPISTITSANSLKNFVVTGRTSAASGSLDNTSIHRASLGLPAQPEQIQHQRSKSVGVSSKFSLDRKKKPPVKAAPVSSTTQPLAPATERKELFSSPYVNKYDTSVQSLGIDHGSNLYSVSNQRASVALNSFDDSFLLRSQPKPPEVATRDPFTYITCAVTTSANSVTFSTVRHQVENYTTDRSKRTSQSSLYSTVSSVPLDDTLVESSVDSPTTPHSYKFPPPPPTPSSAGYCWINESGNLESCVDTPGKLSTPPPPPSEVYKYSTIEEDNLEHYKSLLIRNNSFSSQRKGQNGFSARFSGSDYANLEPTYQPGYRIYENAQALLSNQVPSSGDGGGVKKAPKQWYETDLDCCGGARGSSDSSVHPATPAVVDPQPSPPPPSTLPATPAIALVSEMKPEFKIPTSRWYEEADRSNGTTKKQPQPPPQTISSRYGSLRSSLASPTPSNLSSTSSTASSFLFSTSGGIASSSTISTQPVYPYSPSHTPTGSVLSLRSSVVVTPTPSYASQPMPCSTVAFVPSVSAQDAVGYFNTTASVDSGSTVTSSSGNVPIASCKGNIVEVDVVTVGHIQPGYEETKPYTLSDFYKYSQRYRNANKNNHKVAQPEVSDLSTSLSQLGLVERIGSEPASASHRPVEFHSTAAQLLNGNRLSNASDDNNNSLPVFISPT